MKVFLNTVRNFWVFSLWFEILYSRGETVHMQSLLLYVDSVSISITVYLFLRSIIVKKIYSVAFPKNKKLESRM